MALQIASLNSGSNGNCYYIGNETEAILVDAGISCREIEKRLARLALDILKIKAIFISHEHSDHIQGVEVFSKKYQLPVYITSATLEHSNLVILPHLSTSFISYSPVAIGHLTVTPFPKFHDAIDPHSFVIDYKGVRIGVFTDIGSICTHVINHFKTCHAVFLESNYDQEMLEKGKYPYMLKRRIQGGKGHLSNNEALKLFQEYRSTSLSHLLLSHLSKENNCPDLVKNLFTAHATDIKIVVASRNNESEVYHISNANSYVLPKLAVPLRDRKKKEKKLVNQFQLSLF